ncbi:type I DNA topoisomerase [Candidatus Peregrinibacteria bacterium]|nr:type I DNA topoisomerase [Candidatus Peregrinibacteria bacterium]
MPRHLVIVESPAKAKTIKKFLGKDYIVEASMGHIRDLPKSGLGIDVANNFEPTYEVSEGKESVVKKLQAALKNSNDLWIATDEDREGEAIGWHLTQALKVKKGDAVKRIVFHEITESAIQEAIAHPRTIDQKLVDAQAARRILDRLVGYTLSPFLWKKVYSGLSAGRVQSVAVRIIVDRDREIKAFKVREYWSIEALLETGKKENFSAFLSQKNGEKLEPTTKEETEEILKNIKDKPFAVVSVEEKELTRNPASPFTTSTLQQEAARKLGFSVKQTMVVAQQLYEAGHITYMRTDSVNLSKKALNDATQAIEKSFGREYVLSSPRIYKTKAKGAQEAHEAIRPTEMERTPKSVEDTLDHQQLKLYTLIWNRTIATQMPAAQFKRIGADITVDAYTFRATGQTVIFDGFLRAYSEGKDEDAGQDEDGEKFLPPLAVGNALVCNELKPEQHFTKPPARYTEASLVKKLEEEGIGRPSTYAPTISTIQQRGYIRKDGRNLIPEDIAFTVTDLLAEHFPDIVNLAFTAEMEQSLDDIAEGGNESTKFLRGFFGPFKKLVDSKTKEIKKTDVLKERVLGTDPKTGLEVLVRTGRFGHYVQLGRLEPKEKNPPSPRGLRGARKKKGEGPRTAGVPKHLSIDDVTLPQALGLLSFPRVLGQYGGNDLSVILGRFGPYMKCGDLTAALPKEVEPASVDLAQAIELFTTAAERKKQAALPLRTLGKDPTTGGEILVKDGRYGPYVTDGKTNASLGKKFDPLSITLEQAVELLVKKRARPPRKWGNKK